MTATRIATSGLNVGNVRYTIKMVPRMVEVIYKSRHIDNRQQEGDDGLESFLSPVSRLFEMKLDPGLVEQVKRV